MERNIYRIKKYAVFINRTSYKLLQVILKITVPYKHFYSVEKMNK